MQTGRPRRPEPALSPSDLAAKGEGPARGGMTTPVRRHGREIAAATISRACPAKSPPGRAPRYRIPQVASASRLTCRLRTRQVLLQVGVAIAAD
jgi:hypothetical protein